MALCESVQLGMRQRGYNQGRIVFAEARHPHRAGGENGVHWHSKKVFDTIGP